MNGNGVGLIVDDHAYVAGSLVSLLNESGFDACAVHSGAEALAFVRSHAEVALILLDMSMPDMSGLEVLRAIRVSGGGNPHSPPIVMVSADFVTSSARSFLVASRYASDRPSPPASRADPQGERSPA